MWEKMFLDDGLPVLLKPCNAGSRSALSFSACDGCCLGYWEVFISLSTLRGAKKSEFDMTENPKALHP